MKHVYQQHVPQQISCSHCSRAEYIYGNWQKPEFSCSHAGLSQPYLSVTTNLSHRNMKYTETRSYTRELSTKRPPATCEPKLMLTQHANIAIEVNERSIKRLVSYHCVVEVLMLQWGSRGGSQATQTQVTWCFLSRGSGSSGVVFPGAET